MLRNILMTAMRNLWKHKGYSLINIMGLAVGMAFCIFILIFIRYELSYDKHLDNADHVFRVTNEVEINGLKRHYPLTPGAIGPVFDNNIPEIQSYTRMYSGRSDENFQQLVKYKDKIQEETDFFTVDPSFFKVFPFRFLKGDPETALLTSESVVITESTADRIFGREDPIGKSFEIQGFGMRGNRIVSVTGVIENVPENFHFHFNFLFSTVALEGRNQQYYLNEWTNFVIYTYFLLDKGSDIKEIEYKMADVYERYAGQKAQQSGIKMNLGLQKLTDIHLRSHLEEEIESNGNIMTLYMFGAVAFFTLIIACINFMNFSTARSIKRAKEIGVRKTFGANRIQLIRQFLIESLTLSLVGLIVSCFIVVVFSPVFSSLTGLKVTTDLLKSGFLWSGILGIVFITGVLSGCYPAFFLSNFKPLFIMRELGFQGLKHKLFRKVLVVFQFSISAVILIATIIVISQLRYFNNRDLGFNKEHVIVVPIERFRINPPLKEKILEHPSILNAAYSMSVPGRLIYSFVFVPKGLNDDQSSIMDFFLTHYDLVNTYGMEIISGRDFSIDFNDEDSPTQICLINETAAQRMGWSIEDAVGKEITNISMPNRYSCSIVGVIKDYHQRSLHQAVQPMVIQFTWGKASYLSIRIDENNISSTITYLSNVWKEFEPDRKFDYFFLDDDFARQYKTEVKMGKLFKYFAFVAIVVSCMGLWGLTLFMTEQKKKEIGIRKVLGASIMNIMLKFSSHILVLVLFSNIISWPIAYIVMKNWLQNFTYRINMNLSMYFYPGLVIVFITIITISYLTVRSAKANPIDTLRYE